MQADRLIRLDSWRAISCLGVLWVHCWHINNSLPIQIFNFNIAKLLSIFGNGVDFFFVISGFSIYYFKSSVLVDFSFKNYLSFLLNRFIRIAPAFYLAMIVYWFFYTLNTQNIIQSFIANLTFNQNFYSQFTISEHFWTICIEWQFYLILPLLFYFFISKYSIVKSITIVSITISTIGLLLLWYNPILDTQLPVRFAQFSAGLLLAHYYKNKDLNSKGSLSLLIVGFIILFLGRLCNTFEMLTYINSTLYYSILKISGYTLLAIGFGLILYNTISNFSNYFKFLTWKPLIYIGKISYSFYLWHGLVVFYVFNFFSNNFNFNPLTSLILQFVFCIIITIPISHLSYIYIESKFRWSKLK
jgi:peptidoglycan/LPS O-acetylase OafA/YrhL